MGGGGNGPGQGLLVDVGHIDQRLAFFFECLADIAEPRACAESGGHVFSIRIEDTGEAVEGEHRALCRHERGEGMAGPHRADGTRGFF